MSGGTSDDGCATDVPCEFIRERPLASFLILIPAETLFEFCADSLFCADSSTYKLIRAKFK